MSTFQETRLLKHPTVEKAYAQMRLFFQDGDDNNDYVANAVRTGEIISVHAENPDPDVIAACVLLDGMIIPYQANSFAQTVSEGAAAYLEKFYELDVENPRFDTPGEQAALLAHSIKGLEEVYDEVTRPGFQGYNYQNIKRVLERNEKSLRVIMQGTPETGLAEMALAKLVLAKEALDDMVRNYQAGNVFEKSGLPENPTVRAVYNFMRDWDIAGHPVNTYTETNAAIARVIVETGASNDPDVIGAALLNQYHDTKPGELAEKFSQRLYDLVRETSPWQSMGKDEEKLPPTPEGKIITAAALTYFMEERLEGFQPLKPEELSVKMLQDMEHLRDRLAESARRQTAAGLRARMEAAVAGADKFMHAPAQVKIRKPGSPDIDPGW
jgi:hypothetical protein